MDQVASEYMSEAKGNRFPGAKAVAHTHMDCKNTIAHEVRSSALPRMDFGVSYWSRRKSGVHLEAHCNIPLLEVQMERRILVLRVVSTVGRSFEL